MVLIRGKGITEAGMIVPVRHLPQDRLRQKRLEFQETHGTRGTLESITTAETEIENKVAGTGESGIMV